MLGSAGLVLAGWSAARRGRTDLHHRRMLAGAALGAAFLASYLARSLLVGDTTFGGPAHLRRPYLALLGVHIALAAVAGALGVAALRLALAGRFARHRRLGPWAACLWLLAAATGLAVYLLLYVLYEPGPTVRFWRWGS